MKQVNLAFLVALLLALTFHSYSQTAKAQPTKQIIENKSNFKFIFNIPDNYTKEDVLKKQNANSHYFKIEFDEVSHQVTFNLNKDVKLNESGLVMVRYLMALGLKDVEVESKKIPWMEFNKKYIRS